MSVIAIIGTFDSKGEEHAFIARLIRERGHETLLIDVGSGGPPTITPDHTREQVAASAGIDLAPLLARRDRGECVAAMCRAAAVHLAKLARDGAIHGVISLGGGGGTALATAAMRALPLGFPKLMVSAVAAGNIAPYLGAKDIVMMPSIADVAGLNRLSRRIFAQAAGAICGMVESVIDDSGSRPLIVASMFGNTTACVSHAKEILEAAGFEVLVFAATGAGGRIMESLIESGIADGVLDLTTTELADEIAGGVMSAGPHRLEAAAAANIPVVVAPGCVDMVNFGEPSTVPARYQDRKFYPHNPQVTLMRTSAAECIEIGETMAAKINAWTAPAALMIPRLGLSALGSPGGEFHDPAADEALFTTLERRVRIPIHTFDMEINDPRFAAACAETLISLIGQSR